eukprot:gene3989-5455_t
MALRTPTKDAEDIKVENGFAKQLLADPETQVEVPGLGAHTRFERPPLLATVRMKHGQQVHVLTAHLKSKRPKFLQDAQGNHLEDRDDRKVGAMASLRSLLMRGAEAAALRCIVIDLLQGTNMPLVVMGDFNDNPHSVTTQLVAATSDVAYDKAARDVALFNAYEMQGESALKKDVAYSHIHQGFPEVLDQILVSEEFVAGSRHSLGDVRRVDYFNDHLHEGRDRSRSDHAERAGRSAHAPAGLPVEQVHARRVDRQVDDLVGPGIDAAMHRQHQPGFADLHQQFGFRARGLDHDHLGRHRLRCAAERDVAGPHAVVHRLAVG